jgi:8-oxo-dGTP pyrophosphatase MutT (NUDIX family)
MATTPGTVRQAAAIPFKAGQVCVVSSRSGKRWVVPKGCLEPGKTAGEIALLEAWEEAGLVGMLSPEPVGSYLYDKSGITHHVVVFLMEVSEVYDDFPEKEMRERIWVPVAQALARIEDRGLREILRGTLGQKAG